MAEDKKTRRQKCTTEEDYLLFEWIMRDYDKLFAYRNIPSFAIIISFLHSAQQNIMQHSFNLSYNGFDKFFLALRYFQYFQILPLILQYQACRSSSTNNHLLLGYRRKLKISIHQTKINFCYASPPPQIVRVPHFSRYKGCLYNKFANVWPRKCVYKFTFVLRIKLFIINVSKSFKNLAKYICCPA